MQQEYWGKSSIKIGMKITKWLSFHSFIYWFLKIFYLFIFRERAREGERKGEKHQCVVASRVPPTGDLVDTPGMYPDWESNWWTFALQSSAQSTEPHQPRLTVLFFCFFESIRFFSFVYFFTGPLFVRLTFKFQKIL